MNAAGNEATGVRWAGQEGRVLSGEDLYAGSVRSSKLANSAKLGGTMGYGTSFPASPSTNDVFFRTDRGILYYYDGTRWLSVHEFAYGAVPYSQVPGTLVTASSAALFVTPWPDAPGSGQVYLTRWVSNVFIGATNDGTHNWTLQLKAMDGTVIDSHSTSAMAASSGWNRTVRTINSVRTTSSDRHVLMGAVRNNSPSGINWVNTLHGRLVG